MSDKKTVEKPKRIFDVDVNRAAVKKAATLDEFKKSNPNIFGHLGEDEGKAYEELYKEFTPAAAAKAPAAQTV